MNELVEQYVGKECLIYTISTSSTSTVVGVIESVRDGWISVRGENGTNIVNADYIVRITEYPRKKNGKKRMVIE